MHRCRKPPIFARALLEAADHEHLPEDGEAGLLVRKIVLDLPEPDLLEADYVARGLAVLARVVLTLGTITGLRHIAGSHRLGEYPLRAPFNNAHPRMGGAAP
jgi:hypothetical protein